MNEYMFSRETSVLSIHESDFVHVELNILSADMNKPVFNVNSNGVPVIEARLQASSMTFDGTCLG